MKSKVHRSRILLIILGLGLGYLARLLLGPPASETENQNRFLKPLPDIKKTNLPDQDFDLEIRPGDDVYGKNSQGLVPPIQIPGVPLLWDAGRSNSNHDLVSSATLEPTFTSLVLDRDFEHDSQAAFEPHGNQVCASGCALSRHPTDKLSLKRFHQLTRQFSTAPLQGTSPPLEELLFYGPQTRQLIESFGVAALDTNRAGFLCDELKRTHARISLRVIDSNGDIRTWLKPTRVPLDRRHVFEMETKNLQPLVTSGTVKRVGLDHLWVRL